MPTIKLKIHKQPRVPTVAKKIYQDIYNTPRWKKLRTWYIRNHPFCEDCLGKDKTTLSREVHHVVPWVTGSTLADQEALAFDPENLRALCVDCHKAVH
ncbi:hypothetical protein ES707_16043 [subsurface metagenome]